jgi:5-methylthioribose kinase
MSLKEQFNEIYPNTLFLEHKVSLPLQKLLIAKKWLDENETIVSVEKAGEGNMNFVMRVITNKRSIIVKQARPWVEKYPHVAAPIERVAVEAQFYQAIQSDFLLKSYTPQYLGYEASQFIMAMEDLGESSDFMYAYQKDKYLIEEDMIPLMAFISQLHALPKVDFPLNTNMKQLNHEHIFNYPFVEENGFDLDAIQDGLQALSLPYKRNKPLKKAIHALGEVYLRTEGVALIHGDFYLGSWLKVKTGIKVIDPEFGFRGRPEFDLGVLIAHLKMSEHDNSFIETTLKAYKKQPSFDDAMMWAFAGVEILRRILGLAQLPLSLNLSQKGQLLETASGYVLEAS